MRRSSSGHCRTSRSMMEGSRPGLSCLILLILGRVNTTKSFDDEGEIDEADKHHVEFFESRENASKSLQASEQSLDLVASLVHRAIVFPCIDSIALGRYHGDEV